MPEFILPAEADRCPYCNAIIYLGIDCCPAMAQAHEEYRRETLAEMANEWEAEERYYREMR